VKINNIKQEVTQNMENLREKNQTETQNTVESHSTGIEQVEDRILQPEDQMEIKEKLKSY
jgi:hypothetical protein